jgi:hypothetical protein
LAHTLCVVANLSVPYQQQQLLQKLKLVFQALLFVLLWQIVGAYFGALPVAQAATCTGSAITGVVFRDYNANGVQESNAGGFTEPGIGGLVVTAYDANGTSASCETTATGAYGINPVGAFPVRVEFTLPADGSLNFLKPGAAGGNVNTSVTFVNGPSAKPVGSNESPFTPSPLTVASCGVTLKATGPSCAQSTKSVSAMESPTTGEA